MENVVYVKIKDSSKALGVVASNFYDNPSENKISCVTGTNGKTTVATLLHNLYQALGIKQGYFLQWCIKSVLNLLMLHIQLLMPFD